MNNKIEIHIKHTDSQSNRIKEFEKVEWAIADKEHYGKSVDFTNKHYTFLAENEHGDIVGMLKLKISVNLALVDALLVGSKFRRIGVGKKLLQEAENFAKKQKCTKIYLETNKGWNSVEFYKKNGYTVTGVHEKHALGQDSLIFTKFF